MDSNVPSVSHQLGQCVPQPAMITRVLQPDEQLSYRQKNSYSNDQVSLLLHACSCKESESQTTNGESLNCSFPNCQEMKNLLTHQRTCAGRNECPVADCNSTRKMILKLRGCRCIKCRQAHELSIASISHPESLVQRRLPTRFIDSQN